MSACAASGAIGNSRGAGVVEVPRLNLEVVSVPRFRPNTRRRFVELRTTGRYLDDVIARRDLNDHVLISADPVQRDTQPHGEVAGTHNGALPRRSPCR
jgi:hypothetical protein